MPLSPSCPEGMSLQLLLLGAMLALSSSATPTAPLAGVQPACVPCTGLSPLEGSGVSVVRVTINLSSPSAGGT